VDDPARQEEVEQLFWSLIQANPKASQQQIHIKWVRIVLREDRLREAAKQYVFNAESVGAISAGSRQVVDLPAPKSGQALG
jgi:hypothetical protein